MLLAAIILNIACALAIVLLALKFILGPVPLDYHAEILKKEGTTPSESTLRILSALYRIMGLAFIAVAISMVAMTLIGVQADLLRAKILVLVIGGIISVPSMVITRKVEQITGVKTPWRMAAGLSGGLILAFILAVL